jgi:hypothetical protein
MNSTSLMNSQAYASRRSAMIIRNKRIAAIALGLALSALASPSLAQRSESHMSAARAQALRECNLAAQKYTQHTWADVQIYTYRACMAEHGQQE